MSDDKIETKTDSNVEVHPIEKTDVPKAKRFGRIFGDPVVEFK
jgi:hypothetical protein